MQGVKNFFQGKALGVAEYLIPVLKVCIILFEQVGLIHCKSSATDAMAIVDTPAFFFFFSVGQRFPPHRRTSGGV